MMSSFSSMLIQVERPRGCRSALTCGRLNHVCFTVHLLDDGVHLDDVGDPRSQPSNEVRVLVGNSNLWWDQSVYVIKTDSFLYLTSACELPAAMCAHHFWDDRSKCKTLLQKPAPIQPGGRRQSAEPAAVPEGQILSGEQRWCSEQGNFISFFLYLHL